MLCQYTRNHPPWELLPHRATPDISITLIVGKIARETHDTSDILRGQVMCFDEIPWGMERGCQTSEVLIPIPGTSKRIKCAVALLMLGGACGITDPNMLDNVAEARKPPDVPFKRDLQEDQDSLKPATPP